MQRPRERLEGLPDERSEVARAPEKVYFLYTMEFEYDSPKSDANARKHGIDFAAAERLWNDPELVEIPARTTNEPRWVVVGKIGDRHWSAIVTRRGGKVRIISVRRSRKEEVAIYEGRES